MSQVKVKIGPQSYSIACGEGEEDRVAELAAMIDRQYAKLGGARAALEAQNLVFAALFMADELDDAQKTAKDAKAEVAEIQQELQRAKDDTANALRKASQENEEDKDKSGSKKAELRAEIETLRKAEERARAENMVLKADIAEMQERARHQHDLFGGPAEDAALSEAMAEKLEALALRVEASARELEGQAGTS